MTLKLSLTVYVFLFAVSFGFGQDLQEADLAQGEVLLAKWLGHRSALDKSACIAKATVFREYAEDEEKAPMYREYELRSSISFKKEFFRSECVLQDKVDDFHHGYSILRCLLNKEGNFLQAEEEPKELAGFHSLGKIYKAGEKENQHIPYWGLDPYWLIGGTLGCIHQNSLATDHQEKIQERHFINVSRGYERDLRVYVDPKSGNCIIRRYQDEQFSTEAIFAPDIELPIQIRSFYQIKRDDLFSTSNLLKAPVDTTYHVKWQAINMPQEVVWMPSELAGFVRDGIRPNKPPIVTTEVKVTFTHWWLGEGVPDAIFTLEDLGFADIGESTFDKLKDQESKRAK